MHGRLAQIAARNDSFLDRDKLFLSARFDVAFFALLLLVCHAFIFHLLRLHFKPGELDCSVTAINLSDWSPTSWYILLICEIFFHG